jgi:transcriptional regulator with XRE-family HTH domain
MEKESQTKDKLTSAIDEYLISEEKQGLSYLKPEPKYSRSDLDEFNRELEGVFDLENSDLKSMNLDHISDDGFIRPNESMNSNSKNELKSPDSVSKSSPKNKPKAQKQAEMEAIKDRLGSFSVIRKNLGLNQRKIAKLLLVDPSAVNRWEKAGGDAPAYIYRALEWYSLLQKKHPMMGNNFWLQLDSKEIDSQNLEKIKSELKTELKSELNLVSNQTVESKRRFITNKYFYFCVFTLLAGYLLGKMT